jgi:F-type H+-transporting ATPase subunit gamma
LGSALSSDFILQDRKNTTHKVTVNIVFGGDSGFCGATNAIVQKKIKLQNSNADKMIIFGKKIFTFLNFKNASSFFYRHNKIKKDFFCTESASAESDIDLLCDVLVEELCAGRLHSVCLFYLNFKNMAYSDYREEVLFAGVDVSSNIAFAKYYLKNKIFYAYISTLGTVFANRIKSMESANQNAKKIADFLTLYYNKTRQSKINVELLDIISGCI